MEELKTYLKAIVPVTLSLTNESLDTGIKAAEEGEFNPIQGFVTDEQQLVLYIEKLKDGVVVVSAEVSYSADGSSAAVFKRRPALIQSDIPLGEQIQYAVLCLPSPVQENEEEGKPAVPSTSGAASESETLTSMYSYIHLGFSPLLRSYATSKVRGNKLDVDADETENSGGSDALKQTLPLISKRMNELEYAMRSCLQSLEIPEVHLQIDPIVVERCSKGEDTENITSDLSDAMLNRIQAGVNRWVKEIQKVTKLDRDAGSGTVSEEVQFWHNLERALQQIQRQVEGPEVRLSLDILKQSRRALATILFENDTGLKASTKRVGNYMILMQDFPIGALLAATDVNQIEEAVVQIFTHLKKIKSADEYPLAQALRLVESLSRDVTAQLGTVLSTQQLVQMPYNDFEEATRGCQSLFRTWDDHARQFRELARDLAKRRGSERLPSKLHYEHSALQDRIEEFRVFRASHEKLRDVIQRVIVKEEEQLVRAGGLKDEGKEGDDNSNKENRVTQPAESDPANNTGNSDGEGTLGEVNSAYKLFLAVDVLDVTRDGVVAWENACKLYERKIDRVERRIIEKLTDKLGAAKTADEMFRVFSKFNALFFRHRIRGAIQQFQARLIATVEQDIEELQRKFKKSYTQSQACVMSKVRDVPPVSGAIIWARQIERQLDLYLKRVEAVLGSGWEQHIEGRRLKETGVAFKKKLNTQQMFDHWMKNIQSAPSFEVTGRLFCVEERSGGGHQLNLIVNFDPQIVELFKEVRNVQWLGFRIPYTLKIISDEAKEKYPFAMSLGSTLETYTMTMGQLDDELFSLLSSYVYDAQYAIELSFNKGKGVHWDSDGLRGYSADFAQRVYSLQNKVVDATEKSAVIQKHLVALKSCPYDPASFKEQLDGIQKVVDEMNLASYSHLNQWVKGLDKRIDEILLGRLNKAIEMWIDNFADMDKSTSSSWHEIVLRKHALYLDPPLEEARLVWIRSLHQCLSIVCNLPRIQSSRYDMLGSTSQSLRAPDDTTKDEDRVLLQKPYTFSDLLSKSSDTLLIRAYSTIEEKLRVVNEYVMTWLRYQSLWDMEASDVYARMGETDLENWQQLLLDIQHARSTFDTAEHAKSFGPITVDYQQVQAQVSLRYDAWHKEILTKFGQILGGAMKSFYDRVASMRQILERGSFDAPTNQVVSFITELKEIKESKVALQTEIELFAKGERLLQRQRLSFPTDWIWVANVQGEWDAFQQILSRKEDAMGAELPSLQAKILSEDRLIASKVMELGTEWSSEKPASGELSSTDALNKLSVFEIRATRLQEEWRRVDSAKEALSLARDPGENGDMLETISSELTSLKEVWTSLSVVGASISELKELPWTAVVPKKLRASLDEILEGLRKLPARVKQYEAFEFIQSTVRDYKKTQTLIVDLRSEALKDRHWRQVVKLLGLQNIVFKDMTLGDLWRSDLKKHQKKLSDIFRTAQGEMGLEEFLRQIREFWSGAEFDLINYQNRCRLIRGWDELFTQLDEHTTSLVSMRQSPYFAVFEEEASGWEDKLTRIRVVLDIWIDVQRRWVYLGGILLGSADIKQQLPNEYSRFMSIDNEFISLMRKVAKTPRVLEVISSISTLEHSLQRLADLLEKIQRALGEYLERQRQSFSRFYFVGDEDLLEIIGNTNDPVKIQRHMAKMFAGISSLVLEDENKIAKSMVSREGEIVNFIPEIKLMNTKVNDWLQTVEDTMKSTLLALLERACKDNPLSKLDQASFTEWIDTYPSQILILASQVAWSSAIANGNLEKLLEQTENWLGVLADRVLLGNLSTDVRKKHEQLITEMVHQRDVIRKLKQWSGPVESSFDYLSQIRYQWTNDNLSLRIANSTFDYGFEYQGVGERLVQTPLTDRCYLALTQALHFRLGGNPFGPAGTGKTESVKALGAQLGRFVLVFNCDEHFDLRAMGRIFVGLCQVGAWGCFDEFNRLEERILSAVSQQILLIQRGLLEHSKEITLIKKPVKLNPNVGIFVTMNPGYAGRSNLPDNLKQLFRSIAMIEPDRELIGQVMLFSQGFKQAEGLAGKVVLLFQLCHDQLSHQPHYDFGLRAVKSVLLSAGNLKRANSESTEEEILIQSLCENVVPKLVSEDVPLYRTLLGGVFINANLVEAECTDLREAIGKVCAAKNLVMSEAWVSKVLQLHQVQALRHGIMMVGPSGSGKSTSWRVLLEASVGAGKAQAHVIDPKALSKEDLYGVLDKNTLEWTDGIFTHTLRTILNNVRGEKDRTHWIIFDGDVDPEWAENLNSVLDDNKLLTLPSGERLEIPDNVRIMFEVETLRYATLATVSRCGMIWYSEDTLSLEDIFANYRMSLDQSKLELVETHLLGKGGLGQEMLALSLTLPHVMEVTRIRLVISFFSLVRKGFSLLEDYNTNHPDFPLSDDHMGSFLNKWILFSILWGIGGSLDNENREILCNAMCKRTTIELPSEGTLWDYEVCLQNNSWRHWKESVPQIDIEPQKVMDTDVVIPTVDTVRHADVLHAWLQEHRPLILCGPPGSGKTMSLMSVLQSMPNFELASLNFSSATTPDLILKTFEQYCVYKPTRTGMVLAPPQPEKWLVVFCDEVNLPVADAYGTQHVITFMRQIVEQGGFWRVRDLTWVSVERIQFVSACNPPTDPGRVPLSLRFLRHTPLLLVDYPVPDSLRQIYGTFSRALLKLQPQLRGHGDALTEAMVDVYTANKSRYSADVAPHYVYSPRELSRWTRALFEALVSSSGGFTVDQLVRLWVHEGLRLFHDRLISGEERLWCADHLDSVARNHFPSADLNTALTKPVLFANWLSKSYVSVDQDELRKHVEARLKVFYEEELNVPLVVFDDVLEHVLRIDRVLRQPLGHLLLVGKSGAGKTVLSRFVAWNNGLKVFQIKLSRKYTLENFDEDLRYIMKQAGCFGVQICFIFDESNVLESAFLERMNALLASGEVPGLFEGDEHNALLSACRENGSVLADVESEQLFREFTRNVQRNLHVVFTMNPASSDLKNRAGTSPALFNRCVVDWFGDWSEQALTQVGSEFTRNLDLGAGDEGLRESVVTCLVRIHESVQKVATDLAKRHENTTFVSPRDYLDLINHYVELYNKKREELEEQQLHLNIGLDKLEETATQVENLGQSLAIKEQELKLKNQQANEKLEQMVSDQKEAEKKKADAEVLTQKLNEQNAKVAEQKDVAENELSRAEPALVDAQNAVGNIRKAHLDEMRSLNNPPPAVKMTLEAVCLMLGLSATSWADIRRILQKREFIPDVVNFKSEDLSEDRRDKVNKMLEGNPDFVEEKVQHANKACGPLFKWIVSQLDYAGILLRIQPLRDEIANLAKESEGLTAQHEEELERIEQLETQIATLKDEYAVLIRETETIKTEMTTVKSKVERSTALLKSLSQENERWDEAKKNFNIQMSTLVGDVLLTASFISYAGFFGYKKRQSFFSEWRDLLDEFGVSYKKDLSFIEYTSRPSDRLAWQSCGLPNDNLCIENAIILENFNRFPLIVDPSGQASEFLLKRELLGNKKVVKTSFLDSAFMKQLESALRFGTCLVITDVENIDPILNPVLNREIHRTGGRMLVRLGDQDIDFSPSFSMFLTTRDSSFQFAPDVCSRVTFVNFTVTPSSLQSQCLSRVLKSQRPDVDKQREDLLKLQGGYQARLRELEEALLESLNQVKGNILDNDVVVNTLETLKTEAEEIHQKASEAETVMGEVEKVSGFYSNFASMCSQIFFYLEGMSEVHFSYQFSLVFFFKVLDTVVSEKVDKVDVLVNKLFSLIFRQTRHSLLEKDRLLFALILAKIYKPSERLDKLFEMDSGVVFEGDLTDKLEPESIELKEFDPIDRVKIIERMRPDRLLPAVRLVIQDTIGECISIDEEEDDLKHVLESESDSKHPILMLCTAGYDMSSKVDKLAEQLKVRCRSVAMGSSEGYEEAERAITSASSTEGGWVLLKNVHLASDWLESLEKKLYGMNTTRPDFRLLLTSEISNKIPKSLLRQSLTLMNEAPVGVRSSLLRSLHLMPEERVNRAPVERSRLYFLLAWFHAVLLERLRFAPIGWTKLYEFSDADETCAMDVIDEWIDRVAKNRDHIPPEEIPWDSIRSVLLESTYGGRIDNEFDQQILEKILSQLFLPSAFDEATFLLVSSPTTKELHPPEGTTKAQFHEWVLALPPVNDPTWLGLDQAAENILLATSGKRFVHEYEKMGSDVMLENEDDAEEWIQTVSQKIDTWKTKEIDLKLDRSEELVANPIFRCFERERSLVVNLYNQMMSDINGLASVFTGARRMTNNLQAVADSLRRNETPLSWRTRGSAIVADVWVQDFFFRIDSFPTNATVLPLTVHLGTLFSPGAFITATRQQVAKERNVSLDKLSLVAETRKEPGSYHFSSDVILEGGADGRNKVKCWFSWTETLDSSLRRLPLYLDSTRQHLVTDVSFEPLEQSVLRGIALVAHLTL